MKLVLKIALLFMVFSRTFSRSPVRTVTWHTVDWYAENNISDDSPFIIDSEVKKQLYKDMFSYIPSDKTLPSGTELNKLLANTIYAMMLDRLGRYESLPAYYKSALINGVCCEVNDKLNEQDIRAILYYYPDRPLDETERKREMEAAKHPSIGIDCKVNSTTFDDCFCTQNKTLLYCAALKFKSRIQPISGVPDRICERELLELIEHERIPDIHPTKLARFYYIYQMGNKMHTENVHDPSLDRHTEWEIATAKKEATSVDKMCMAIDPVAEDAIKDIFAANALRWTLESYMFQKIFNGTNNDIDSACLVVSFKNSDIGRCACRKETGITFCILNIRAEYLKRIGFLSCNGDEMKFVHFKYPVTLPAFACLSDATAAAHGNECKSFRNIIVEHRALC